MAKRHARILPPPNFDARSGAQINLRMNRLTLRFEHFVHLDTMLVHEDFADPVRTIIDSEFEAVREALLESGVRTPGVKRATDVVDLEAFFTDLAGEHDLGFLVKAQQPYFFIAASNRLEYSWERSRNRWFHAESYSALLDNACDWAAFHHDAAWARARSAASHGSLPSA
jgi:hypothetical protein